jgi:hypothetical protein
MIKKYIVDGAEIIAYGCISIEEIIDIIEELEFEEDLKRAMSEYDKPNFKPIDLNQKPFNIEL